MGYAHYLWYLTKPGMIHLAQDRPFTPDINHSSRFLENLYARMQIGCAGRPHRTGDHLCLIGEWATPITPNITTSDHNDRQHAYAIYVRIQSKQTFALA
jgi:hypothetical protein